MKVLFVATAYPRHEGDVITPWMGETIRRLKAAGTDVEVLAPAYRGAADGIVDGVMVHRFRYAPRAWESLTHDMPALDRIAGNPLFAALLPSYVVAGTAVAARLAREGKFDVVHVFWPIPHGIFGIAGRRASGAALVSTFFSAELSWRGIARVAIAPLLRHIVNLSDAVTVISTHAGERLHEYAPGATSVTIPFGAAASEAAPPLALERRTEDPFNLLFVGRLVRRKGVDVLLRAAHLLREDARLRVRIVGDGPERDALVAEASRLALGPRVSFEGMVDSVRLKDYFTSCDALVLPAVVTPGGDTEGLGVVLIEAMGYGKLVIASAAGGITDIVRDGDTGLLVKPGDAAALASAIERAMDHPAEMVGIAERGTAFAARAFSWDSIVSNLCSVYASAVNNRNNLTTDDADGHR